MSTEALGRRGSGPIAHTKARPEAPPARSASVRGPARGNAAVPLIVLYMGATTAAGLMVAGGAVRLVDVRDSAVSLALFLAVFAAVVIAAVLLGGRVVRRLPR